MKQILLIITALITSLPLALNAQQFSKGYLDSVKQFYSDWSASRKDFTDPLVLDNRSYPRVIDECIFTIYGAQLDKNPSKVYKKITDSSSPKGYVYTDSTTFTGSDMQELLQKLQVSKSLTWPQDYFPSAKIIDTGQYFKILKNTPSGTQKPGGWVLSLPVFVKNGTFSISYYMYYCPANCTKHGIIVYKNENGHWKSYGKVLNRDL